MTNSIKGMRIAGLVLAVAVGCGATEASAQLRVFAGPGSGGGQAPGSAGAGTAGLGLGGFGSATENLGLGNAGAASSLPSQNQGAGTALGLAGAPTAPSQGSLSSAIDRPSSPLNSVTNSLMGPVGAGTTIPAIKPVRKHKQNGNAGATASNGHDADVASKAGSSTGSSKSP